MSKLQGPLCESNTRNGHCGHARHESCGAIRASASVDRLTDDDHRWLAMMTRRVHYRCAARHERERLAAGAEPCQCDICAWVRRQPGYRTAVEHELPMS
jgi:hypothetical protein